MTAHDRICIGITYGSSMDPRSERDLPARIERLVGLDPRVEVVVEPYEESMDLRTRRGADPDADLRAESPSLSSAQAEVFARAEILMAHDLPPDIGAVAPNLRWVQAISSGFSHHLSAGLEGAEVALCNAAGSNSVSIAEFALARLFSFWKRHPAMDRAQREHRWQAAHGREIAGLTLGIVGLGSIGREIAARARAFGMTVLASRGSARPGDVDASVDEVFPAADLHDMLRRCDGVISVVPENPRTIDLFDSAAFAAMPPGSVFCNVGRGTAVVEAALVDALERKHLRAAALDVFREEPLPASSPLWDVENLHLSGHCAVSGDRFWDTLHDIFATNLGRYLAGRPLSNVVLDPAGWATEGTGTPR